MTASAVPFEASTAWAAAGGVPRSVLFCPFYGVTPPHNPFPDTGRAWCTREKPPMPDDRGWPDPTNPGVPANPDQPGPHLVVGQDGKRRWMWWESASAASRGDWLFTGGSGLRTAWTYIGHAVSPDG